MKLKCPNFPHFAAGNDFNGTIPTEIGLLTNLIGLDLGMFIDIVVLVVGSEGVEFLTS
jgi:hypothetical protein